MVIDAQLANRRGLAAELEALAFVRRRYPVAPTHPTGGASGEGRSAVGVGKVGVFAGAEALDQVLGPPEVGDGVELLDADLLELEI